IAALSRAGMSPAAALGAASWAARDWLGRPGLSPGERADLVVFPTDPRVDLGVLATPTHVLLRGRPVGRPGAS
ncbi:MAG: hypothetical protein QOG57_4390, partial [Pseudonocardiales bacterium]|nr:hypothetical protein [Pseudonocardiales bacterium]